MKSLWRHGAGELSLIASPEAAQASRASDGSSLGRCKSFFLMSRSRIGLFPVRFGQAEHAPAEGKRFASLASKGAVNQKRTKLLVTDNGARVCPTRDIPLFLLGQIGFPPAFRLTSRFQKRMTFEYGT